MNCVKIISREFVKPSSSTPCHLRNFKISMLDQLAPQHYIPMLLFYYPNSDSNYMISFATTSQRLKHSLSQTLTHFYPLAGRLSLGHNNTIVGVDCNDQGALVVEAHAETELSAILESPELDLLHRFLPFHPYDDPKIRSTCTDDDDQHGADHHDPQVAELVIGVQINAFNCGGIAIGVCLTHKIADVATMASFLNSWATTSTGINVISNNNIISNEPFDITSPRLHLDSASLLFPPIKDINPLTQNRGEIRSEEKKKIVTRRFVFEAKNLASLRAKVGNNGAIRINPTRVESVTALIWKSAMEVAKLKAGKETLPKSLAIHIVNIRRIISSIDGPPISLPDDYDRQLKIGNLWQSCAAFFMEEEMKELELGCLATRLRESIRRIDSDYVTQLQGGDGIAKASKCLREAHLMAAKGEVDEMYGFSSLTMFPFYEIDFGCGKPTWVCTISQPFKNFVVLMSSPGDGIEAWVTLAENDMVEFQRSHELSQFASPTY